MMRKSVRKAWACFLAAALAATGLGDFSVTDAASRKPTITMNKSALLIKKGQKAKLKVKSAMPKKVGKRVKYEISNKKIATVSKKGVVRGKKVGAVVIRVTSKVNRKATARVPVIVAKVVPKKVKLNAKKLTVDVGAEKALKATVTPKKMRKYYKRGTWSSRNEEVAIVSQKGVVTGKTVGETVITFSTLNGKKATCSVTVSASADTDPVDTDPSVTDSPATGSAVTDSPATGSAVTGSVATGSATETAEAPASTDSSLTFPFLRIIITTGWFVSRHLD